MARMDTTPDPAASMRTFGDAVRASVVAGIAALTESERREYDRLCPSMLLPIDALGEVKQNR